MVCYLYVLCILRVATAKIRSEITWRAIQAGLQRSKPIFQNGMTS